MSEDDWRFRSPPPFEKLVGDLQGACSERINIQHRLVYQVLKAERTVKVLRMWTHYDWVRWMTSSRPTRMSRRGGRSATS